MSKYDLLWAHVKGTGADILKLGYDEIQQIGGTPLDHSFLNYNKELLTYGYQVGKISMKEKAVLFHRLQGE